VIQLQTAVVGSRRHFQRHFFWHSVTSKEVSFFTKPLQSTGLLATRYDHQHYAEHTFLLFTLSMCSNLRLPMTFRLAYEKLVSPHMQWQCALTFSLKCNSSSSFPPLPLISIQVALIVIRVTITQNHTISQQNFEVRSPNILMHFPRILCMQQTISTCCSDHSEHVLASCTTCNLTKASHTHSHFRNNWTLPVVVLFKLLLGCVSNWSQCRNNLLKYKLCAFLLQLQATTTYMPTFVFTNLFKHEHRFLYYKALAKMSN